jgi:hypothetical protein
MMRGAACGLALLLLMAWAGRSMADGKVVLRYRGAPGQVAVYRLSLKAAGEQVSLGERRPINVEAEFELREQVVATGPAESFSLELTATPVKTKDPTGTFGKNEGSRAPKVQVTLTPRGEAAASPLAGNHIGPYQRAFAALMAEPSVVLPEEAVAVGEVWQSRTAGTYRRSRLVAVRRSMLGLVARIDSTITGPVRLQEGSEGLGLNTSLSGNQTQRSTLQLLTDRGVVLRDKGVTTSHTSGEIALELRGGVRRFPVRSQMRIVFDLRLVTLDGMPVKSD